MSRSCLAEQFVVVFFFQAHRVFSLARLSTQARVQLLLSVVSPVLILIYLNTSLLLKYFSFKNRIVDMSTSSTLKSSSTVDLAALHEKRPSEVIVTSNPEEADFSNKRKRRESAHVVDQSTSFTGTSNIAVKTLPF